MPDKAILSVREIGQYLGRSPSTIYRMVERQEIPYIPLGARQLGFPKDAIDEWVEEELHKPRSHTGDIRRLQRAILNTPLDGDIRRLGGVSEMPKGNIKSRLNLGYGAVYQRKTKAGTIRWYLDYRDAQGKRVQKVAVLTTTREEAILALREEVRKVFNGLYGVKDEQPEMGFREFVDMFIQDYSKTNKRSWKDDKCRLSRLADFFGDVLLQSISPLDIEKFKAAGIGQGLSKSTVNRYLAILKRMYNVAITWGKAKDNPMKQVKLYPETDNLKERILSSEEEVRLLANSPEHLIPVLIVALNTGMRLGEILGLTWEQVDFQAKEIKVLRTKSGRPRIVDINSRLFETLAGLRERDGSGQYVFLNPKTGKPYTKLRKSFKQACRKAKIRDLRFHDLRHTFASRLVERGADIIRVKELLGHSTVRITERYLHSNREERKRAVELLCRKPADSEKTPSNLLHICDTEEEPGAVSRVFPLFSVN